MIERRVTLPTLGLIAVTRVILGVGVGLLLSRHLSRDERRGFGAGLFVLGALSTIPLAAKVFGACSAKAEMTDHRRHRPVTAALRD